MKTKTVYILRGVSGSGKSSLAKELIQGRNGVIVTADDYFETDAGYVFDITKLGLAHGKCQSDFVDYLDDNTVDLVVVANTNTKESDWKFYEQEARKRGCNVYFMVVENRHGNKDVHNVPSDTLTLQEQRIKQSLKLK